MAEKNIKKTGTVVFPVRRQIPELMLGYFPGSEVMITPNDWPTIVAFCFLIGVLFVF